MLGQLPYKVMLWQYLEKFAEHGDAVRLSGSP